MLPKEMADRIRDAISRNIGGLELQLGDLADQDCRNPDLIHRMKPSARPPIVNNGAEHQQFGPGVRVNQHPDRTITEHSIEGVAPPATIGRADNDRRREQDQAFVGTRVLARGERHRGEGRECHDVVNRNDEECLAVGRRIARLRQSA